MRNLSVLLLFFIAGLPLAVFSQHGTVSKIPINTLSGNPDGYVEYLPDGYDSESSKVWPTIFWMHGLGENGNGSNGDLDKIYNKQISNWLKTNDVPFIVLCPQDNNGYFEHPEIENFVAWAKTIYKIDEDQVHAAGLSAGGYGLRDWLKNNTTEFQKLATMTPMSTNFTAAGMDDTHRQKIIDSNIRVWFHSGKNDGAPNNTQQLVDTHDYIYNINAEDSRLTEYIGVGHSAWEEVYDNSGRDKDQSSGTIQGQSSPYFVWEPNAETWYEWLLSHPKKGTETAPSDILLSKSVIENNLDPNTVIAQINALGTPLFTFNLVEGAGDTDNDEFEIVGYDLVLLNGSDLDTKSSYSFRLEVTSKFGSFQKEFTLNVIDPEKILLTVTADDKEMAYGQELPEFTLTYDGFTDSDNASVLETEPSVSTIASSSSDAGEYTIHVTGGESTKYNFLYIDGTLTINKEDQTILVSTILEQTTNIDYVLIEAEVNSGLDLTYELVDGPGTIIGDTIFLSGEIGTINFLVKQTGNNNYNAAEETGSFNVVLLGLNPLPENVQIYPNPVFKNLVIKIPVKYLNSEYKIFTLAGQVISSNILKEPLTEIDVSFLNPGHYIFKTENEINFQFIKK